MELLERWRHADERIRENKYSREQIAKFIMSIFKVCRDTAYRDIVNAERVFVSSYPLNKQYETGLRIEFLKRKINEMFLLGDNMTAANLEKVLQKYIDAYPDAIVPHSPKTIIYKLIQNNTTITNNVASAIQEAEQAFASSGDVLQILEAEDERN